MSYLLAGGCSFTDENYKSILVEHNTDYEKWPTILAKKLGIYHVVNTAVSGGSNDMMFKAVTDAIMKRKPTAVFMLMTGWDRISVHNFSINYATIIDADYEDRNNVSSDVERRSWIKDQGGIVKFCKHTLEHSATVKYIVNNTMRQLYLLQKLCSREGIDLIVGQALRPMCGMYFDDIAKEKYYKLFDKNMFNMNAYAKEMINCPYFDKIDYRQIAIGWPFFEEIGGQYFESKMVHEHYVDPKLDGHPNGLGHKMFADIFYQEYKDRYCK